jgi:hypothetical protein
VRRRRLSSRQLLNALVERGRIVPALPDSVRTRVVARARATLGTVAKEGPPPAPVAHRRGLPVVLAAAVAFVGGVAAASVALHTSRSRTRTPHRPRRSRPSRRLAPPPLPHRRRRPPRRLRPAARRRLRPEPPAATQESYAAELGILQRAQRAYAAHDFTATCAGSPCTGVASRTAVSPRSARRSHEGAGRRGRDAEARQAASAFEARYPRSPLLR